MSLPPVLSFPTLYRGDAWDGMTVGPILEDINGVPTPLALPCQSCRMHFRNKDTGELEFALSNNPGAGEGSIVINNAAQYTFTFPKQVLGLDAGSWEFDFETIDTGGFPRTWFQGVVKVKQDKTYG